MQIKGKYLVLLCCIVFSLATFAANKNLSIEVKGTVTEKGSSLSNAVVSLFADSTLLKKITSPTGDFSFVLHADTDYMFTFSKAGYISKCIVFSTKDIPIERASQSFSPYDIEVSLFKEIKGVDVNQLFSAPLAMIRFNKDLSGGGDFMYDEKYAKSIKPFLKALDFEINQEFERANNEKQVAIRDGELKRQRIMTGSSIIVLILVLIFAVYAYKNYRIKRKLNGELDVKNKHIEQKNREITDSINYAKRIQNAILPSHEIIRQALPDSFILFKPKDIVSGDFYFFLHNEGSIYFGVADCTGHGVPGAFMSLIGYEKLYDASQLTSHTGEILASVNKGIRKSLRQTSSKDSTRDGMDIALCCFQKEEKGMNVSFSGANRPLWIVRKGSSSVEEFKPTKKAIGGFTEEEQDFDLYQTKVNEGDTLYMFSDGYADQFGGERGKKLSTRKFKQILLEIRHLGMADQLKHLEDFFETWKSKEEQVDDILVLGVRV